jgi:hypothetical protein
LHPTEALLLTFGVPYREDLVNDQNLAVKMSGNGETETNRHAAAITLDRCIDVLLATTELDNLIEMLGDFMPTHPEDGSVEVDVFSASQFRVKSSTNLQQTRDPPFGKNSAGGRLRDSGK